MTELAQAQSVGITRHFQITYATHSLSHRIAQLTQTLPVNCTYAAANIEFLCFKFSNQCSRLVANTIIYYNSAILSYILTKCVASSNTKAVALITRMSPAA